MRTTPYRHLTHVLDRYKKRKKLQDAKRRYLALNSCLGAGFLFAGPPERVTTPCHAMSCQHGASSPATNVVCSSTTKAPQQSEGGASSTCQTPCFQIYGTPTISENAPLTEHGLLHPVSHRKPTIGFTCNKKPSDRTPLSVVGAGAAAMQFTRVIVATYVHTYILLLLTKAAGISTDTNPALLRAGRKQKWRCSRNEASEPTKTLHPTDTNLLGVKLVCTPQLGSPLRVPRTKP